MVILDTELLYDTGDVLLVPGEGANKRYLASPFVFGLASPVFKAMFSDRYAEGQHLSSSSPKEPLLQGDDKEALTTVLRYMHFKEENDPVSGSDIYQFSVGCDKYNCILAMKLSSANADYQVMTRQSCDGGERHEQTISSSMRLSTTRPTWRSTAANTIHQNANAVIGMMLPRHDKTKHRQKTLDITICCTLQSNLQSPPHTRHPLIRQDEQIPKARQQHPRIRR